MTMLWLCGMAVMLVVGGVSAEEGFQLDITVRYYAHAILTCSDNSTDPTPTHIQWIIPDGSLLSPGGVHPEGILFLEGGMTLNVTKVTDEQFGYYYCLVLKPDKSLDKVIRRGLNVNGADFSELHDQYRHNAMIGGIAAAVMVVLIGSACLVWHFRFREDDEDREDLYKMNHDELEKTTYGQTTYDNQAYNSIEEKVVPPADDSANGDLQEAKL